MTKAKRVYKQRPLTLEDVGREFVKGQSFEVQLAVSQLIAKAKQEAQKQRDGAADGVIDFQRGWKLTEMKS